MFRIVWGVLLASTFTAGALLAPADARTEGRAVHEVTLSVLPPGRPPVDLKFDVMAASSSEAESAARSAVASLVPGAAILEPPSAVAAWQPWTWRWSESELPVPVAYNPGGAPVSVGPQLIVAGLQAWSSVATSSFGFRYAGVTENTASILESGPDGENVVSWASLNCDRGCVLGITSKQDAHEVDMLLNSNPQAAEQLGVGTTVDWRTVILHELGHMAGLEHSCPVPFGPCTGAEADAVMFYQYRGILRKLAEDDIAGISALYPSGSTPPSPSPTSAPGGSPTPPPAPEFPVILEAGWNLVLLPEGPPSAVTGAMNCVAAIYAQFEGEWRSHIPGVPAALQTLTALDGTTGYWLLAERPCAHIF